MNTILEKKDKEIVYKYLLSESNENFFDVNKSTDFGLTDWNIYKNEFKNRNGFTLESIPKLSLNLLQKMCCVNVCVTTDMPYTAYPDNTSESNKPKMDMPTDETKRKKPKDNMEMVIKNVDFQGIVTGLILEPGDPNNRDLQKQWLTKEEIYKSMVDYMKNHRNLGLMHESILKSNSDNNPDAYFIESWQTPVDIIYGEQVAKAGSWLMTWEIVNETIKKDVQEGKLNGFSIGGIANIIGD